MSPFSLTMVGTEFILLATRKALATLEGKGGRGKQGQTGWVVAEGSERGARKVAL